MADVGPVSGLTARTPLMLSGDRLYLDDGAAGDFSMSLAVLQASLTKAGKVTVTQPATGSTLTIVEGKTLTASNTLTLTGTDGITAAFGGGLAIAATKILTVSNTLTLAGTDATTLTFPTTSATIARTDAAQSFTGIQTFVAPILGTPTSGTLTNCTGLPAAGVVGTAAVLGANTFTGNQTISGASLIFSGNISAAAWTTAGIRHQGVAASFTDTSSSGTVAAAYTNSFGVGTILASSATTYTNYFGSYFSDPVASTNVTMTAKWALGADSAKISNTLIGLAVGGASAGIAVPNLTGYGFITGGATIYSRSSGFINLYSAGDQVEINVTTFALQSTVMLGWSSGVVSFATVDTAFMRLGAANSRQGKAPSATPVAQIFTLGEASRPATDTNIAGAMGTVQSGLGTGTGGGGPFKIQTAPAIATGTATNVYADRIAVAGKQVTLTESTATTVLNVAVASGTTAGGTLAYTIRSDDATDFQSLSGTVNFAAVNKGGTLTAALSTPVESVVNSSGTLTVTVTAVANGNGVDLKLNAVSSLTQTTLYAYITSLNHGTGTVTFQ